MAFSELHPKGLAPHEEKRRAECPAIGLVSEKEFARAKIEIPGLSVYVDYSDWLDAREGLQMGLAMAGVDVAIAPVDLEVFLQWRSLTGAAADEEALDSFASTALAIHARPNANALAVIREADFAAHRDEVAGLADRLDFQAWMRHREATRLARTTDQLEIPIRLDGFLDWCACMGEAPTEAALDLYAQLILEHLAAELYH